MTIFWIFFISTSIFVVIHVWMCTGEICSSYIKYCPSVKSQFPYFYRWKPSSSTATGNGKVRISNFYFLFTLYSFQGQISYGGSCRIHINSHSILNMLNWFLSLLSIATLLHLGQLIFFKPKTMLKSSNQVYWSLFSRCYINFIHRMKHFPSLSGDGQVLTSFPALSSIH